MVKIRLKLKGRKNAPSYRIVVIDSKKKRDGKYIEDLGYFNPTNTPTLLHIEKDRYNYWVSTGAQVSEAVKKLLDGNYKFVKYDPKAAKEEPKTEEVKEEVKKEEQTEEVKTSDKVEEAENTKSA